MKFLIPTLALFAIATDAPAQCPGGVCPLASRVVATLRPARFQLAAVATRPAALPLPMSPPYVPVPATLPGKAPSVPVAASVAVSGPRLSVLRHARLREVLRNRMTARLPLF